MRIAQVQGLHRTCMCNVLGLSQAE